MESKLRKITSSVTLAAAIGAIAITAAARETTVERKGIVAQILMNPEGDADGLLLENGTQVKFPPHLSQKLRATIATKNSVTVKGVEERGHVMRADSITDDKTGKTIVDTPPAFAHGEIAPPTPGGPADGVAPRGPLERQAGLAELTVKGTVKNQLFGPRGDVNGVILGDGAIIHLGPRVIDESKVSLGVGKQIQATGFGTRNDFGESLEATEIKNF